MKFQWCRADLAAPSPVQGKRGWRDISPVLVELEEISNALEAFKPEVAGGASVGEIGDPACHRMTKKVRSVLCQTNLAKKRYLQS
jgi:hypothetical protein